MMIALDQELLRSRRHHTTPHVNSDHANTNKTDNMGVAVPELKQYDPRPTHITTVASHTRITLPRDLGETRI